MNFASRTLTDDDDEDIAPPGVDPKSHAEASALALASGDADAVTSTTSNANEETQSQPKPQPKPLHRTLSIFLRNLAPMITQQEVEAVCRSIS